MMDLFTCGMCNITFHKLDSFLQHKQIHNQQNVPRIVSLGEERVVTLKCKSNQLVDSSLQKSLESSLRITDVPTSFATSAVVSDSSNSCVTSAVSATSVLYTRATTPVVSSACSPTVTADVISSSATSGVPSEVSPVMHNLHSNTLVSASFPPTLLPKISSTVKSSALADTVLNAASSGSLFQPGSLGIGNSINNTSDATSGSCVIKSLPFSSDSEGIPTYATGPFITDADNAKPVISQSESTQSFLSGVSLPKLSEKITGAFVHSSGTSKLASANDGCESSNLLLSNVIPYAETVVASQALKNETSNLGETIQIFDNDIDINEVSGYENKVLQGSLNDTILIEISESGNESNSENLSTKIEVVQGKFERNTYLTSSKRNLGSHTGADVNSEQNSNKNETVESLSSTVSDFRYASQNEILNQCQNITTDDLSPIVAGAKNDGSGCESVSAKIKKLSLTERPEKTGSAKYVSVYDPACNIFHATNSKDCNHVKEVCSVNGTETNLLFPAGSANNCNASGGAASEHLTCMITSSKNDYSVENINEGNDSTICSDERNNLSDNSITLKDTGNQTCGTAVEPGEETIESSSVSATRGSHGSSSLPVDNVSSLTTSAVGSGMSDTYTSAPGLYMLVLNADNTFTLVAGGCQGTSLNNNSQMFVCRRCRKFAFSQVEVLNHVSVNHPEDIDKLSQCVMECEALPSFGEVTEVGTTEHVLQQGINLYQGNNGREVGNSCLTAEGSDSFLTNQESDCSNTVTLKRNIKKKLGRPRKVHKLDQDQDVNVKKEKSFILEGNTVVCTDCKKAFHKWRQFDKHRCVIWQTDQDLLGNSTDLTIEKSVLQEKDSICNELPQNRAYQRSKTLVDYEESTFEEDIEEEWKWKRSRSFKRNVKTKLPDGEKKRKRGRQPKVDSLPFSSGESTLIPGNVAEDESVQSPPIVNADLVSSHKPTNTDNNPVISNAEIGSSPEFNMKVDDPAQTSQSRCPSVVPFKDSCRQVKAFADGLVSSTKAKTTAAKGSEISDAVLSNASSMSRSSRSGIPNLDAIPTLPLFSNPRQQERLHNWITQIDLSFVDKIINKLHPERREVGHSVTMYKCQECNVQFRSLLSCRRHCARHMSRKAFTCPDCDFSTTNVGALYSHYRNHTQSLYSCDKCDFKARIKAHYRDHLETHSPSRYICKLCQRPYSTLNSLKSHIYLYHRNEDGMNYLKDARRKTRAKNKQSFMSQCTKCYKLFNEKSSSNKHSCKHTTVNPEITLKCEICGFQALRRDTVKRHITKHKVIYICCVCGGPYVTVNSLCLHLNEGICTSTGQDVLRQSLLCSYTTHRTLPSLLSNKKLGPLLRSLNYAHQTDHRNGPFKTANSLIKQLEDAGYKQIADLLQGNQSLNSAAEMDLQTSSDIMKIVINTQQTSNDEEVLMDEERFIIINEDNEEDKHPIKFARFLSEIS